MSILKVVIMVMSKIRKAKRYIINAPLLYFYTLKQRTRTATDKIIYLDIQKNHYKRYLYSFLKFFELEGYTIYVEKNIDLFDELRREMYASFLLSEGIVNFGKPGKHEKLIRMDDALMSPDYFATIKNSEPDNSFHVPMSQHPLMYHAGFWNQPVEIPGRKRSVFMAGNFDSKSYNQLKEDGIFEIMSRRTVYEYLRHEELLYPVATKPELMDFLKSGDDNKVILVNRMEFDIPMAELRSVISSFEFFFALPGVVMPFSHNIIEAMSVGTIPLIQEKYANMFKPALTEANAVIFKDKNDLVPKLNYIFSLPKEKTAQLRDNVYAYYTTYLTPGGLVKCLENSAYDKIYLQAEHYSVELAKKTNVKLNGKTII